MATWEFQDAGLWKPYMKNQSDLLEQNFQNKTNLTHIKVRKDQENKFQRLFQQVDSFRQINVFILLINLSINSKSFQSFQIFFLIILLFFPVEFFLNFKPNSQQQQRLDQDILLI